MSNPQNSGGGAAMSHPTWAQAAFPEHYAGPPKDGRMLWVNEEYLSVQCEGANAGTSAYFVRLARCNLRCAGCDTQFDKYIESDAADVAERARVSLAPLVVLTGGEPTLQNLGSLVDALHAAGLRVAVETNGTRAVHPAVDWITVSPKTERPVQRAGDELKVLVTPELKDDDLERLFGPGSGMDFRHRFVQPVWGSIESERRTVALVNRLPHWRLSMQVHKYLGLR